jgi:hypothetical protein
VRPNPKARVMVYSFALAPTMDDEGECTSVESEIHAIETVPVPEPGEEVTFWVRVPAFQGVAYGVLLGDRAGTVEEQLKASATCSKVGSSPTQGGVIVSEPSCEECHCT